MSAHSYRMAGVLLLAVTFARTPAADDAAKARELLDQAIKAAGGEEKLAGLHAVWFKTSWTFPAGSSISQYSQQGTVQGFDQHQAVHEATQDGKQFRYIDVVDGDKAWFSINGKTVESDKDVTAVRLRVFYVLRLPELLLPLRGHAYKLEHIGEQKIGEANAVGLRAVHKDRPDVDSYFDKQTGLLVKSEAVLKMQNGQDVRMELFFKDHKDFDGLKHFTTVTVHLDGERSAEIELTDLKPLGKADASTFAKP